MSESFCTVCGASVTKRQSLAYKGGRACRTHPEVVAESQERVAKEQEQRKEDHRQIERMLHPPVVPRGPSCWCCHREGIMARDHFLRMMVANEKCMLQGKSFLDQNAMREAYGEIVPVLVPIAVSSNSSLVRASRDGWMMHSMTEGQMMVCYDCAKKHGEEEQYKRVLSPKMDMPDPVKTLALMGAIVETSGLGDAIRQQARAEIAVDKEQVIAVFGEKPLP